MHQTHLQLLIPQRFLTFITVFAVYIIVNLDLVVGSVASAGSICDDQLIASISKWLIITTA